MGRAVRAYTEGCDLPKTVSTFWLESAKKLTLNLLAAGPAESKRSFWDDPGWQRSMSIFKSEGDTAHPTVVPHQIAELLQNTVHQRSHYLLLRRICDILIVLLVALPTSLVVALAAVAILCTMGRPLFFLQDRVGLGGKVFRMAKLRTMTEGPSTHIGATLPGDQRITSIGQLLRDSHIDELPQLWNVWRGDMSILGPRPEQPHLVNIYRDVIPNYSLRHIVRPGLSGYAQVYFGYAANLAETRTKLEYDLYYVRNLGPLLDLRIILRTAALVLKH